MKKLTAFLFAFTLCACLVGCNTSSQKVKLIKNDNVKSVAVTSLPELYEYTFYDNAAKEIVDHLASLHLNADFKENPDDCDGMTWVICIQYENGKKTTVYHFGNMFIRAEDGPWYKMAENEAGYLDSLIKKLNNQA